MTGNDNVLKLECEIKDISVYELCIQMLNVLIHFLRKEKDEIPPRIKFPTIVILMSIIVDRGSNLSAQIAHWSPPAMAPNQSCGSKLRDPKKTVVQRLYTKILELPKKSEM